MAKPMTMTPEFRADAMLVILSGKNTPEQMARFRADLTAAFKALDAHDALVEACKGLLDLFDSGWAVRDTSRDHEPGYATRQIKPVQSLAAAHAAITLATKEPAHAQ